MIDKFKSQHLGMINEFKGEYSFLSNFYPCLINYEDLMYTSSEAAFQAAKTLDREERLEFCYLGPNEAKKKGRKLKLRSDWEEIKNRIMLEILRDKFLNSFELSKLLLSTENKILIEGNIWNDTYWGICNNNGKNMLGKALMLIRNELNYIENNN